MYIHRRGSAKHRRPIALGQKHTMRCDPNPREPRSRPHSAKPNYATKGGRLSTVFLVRRHFIPIHTTAQKKPREKNSRGFVRNRFVSSRQRPPPGRLIIGFVQEVVPTGCLGGLRTTCAIWNQCSLAFGGHQFGVDVVGDFFADEAHVAVTENRIHAAWMR